MASTITAAVSDSTVVFANYYAANVEPCTEAHILKERWQISIKC